jgi:hypothetical protein
MAGSNLSRRAEDVVGYREVSQANRWINTQISSMQGTKPEGVGDGTLSLDPIAVGCNQRRVRRIRPACRHSGAFELCDKLNSTKLEASVNVPFQLDHVAVWPLLQDPSI